MRRLWLAAVMLALAVASAACAAGGAAGDPGDGSASAAPQQGAAPAGDTGGKDEASAGGEDADKSSQGNAKSTVYPLTVQDADGQTLTFDQAPQRIVSVSPAETEILFALGLGERIVGVSDYDDYPEEAMAKPKMGGIVTPNEEAILSAAPDLVIGGISLDEQAAGRLRELGLKLYRTNPKTLDDVIANILQIGIITDAQGRAEEAAAAMREDIRTVTEAVARITEEERKRVYAEFSPGWTVGSGEFLDELIRLAGGVNIAGDTEGWNRVDEEKVIRDDPEVILYAAGLTDFDSGKALEELIKSRGGWSGITAIREGRLIPLDMNIMVRPGPRLTQALQEIARGLYPELFEQ